MIYLLPAIILVLGFIGLKYLFTLMQMNQSEYQDISENTTWSTAFNKGNRGEFLTFRILEKLGETNILTNIYLPKKNGESTEVDLIMVNSKGIFVFESKNYSGWIFGDEKSKNWTQCLNPSSKYKFFNPIMQNKGHISAVNDYFENKYKDYFYSYIIFSERCELKKISVTSSNVFVLKRDALYYKLKREMLHLPEVLTPEQISDIYQKLKAKTLVDDDTKQQHIDAIKSKHYQ